MARVPGGLPGVAEPVLDRHPIRQSMQRIARAALPHAGGQGHIRQRPNSLWHPVKSGGARAWHPLDVADEPAAILAEWTRALVRQTVIWLRSVAARQLLADVRRSATVRWQGS